MKLTPLYQGCLWGGPPARPPARPPDTLDRPLRLPNKGQMGIDWLPMVNLKGQMGTQALPWAVTSTAILHVTTSTGNNKKSYCSKVNLE
jgi:hypothetical protein